MSFKRALAYLFLITLAVAATRQPVFADDRYKVDSPDVGQINAFGQPEISVAGKTKPTLNIRSAFNPSNSVDTIEYDSLRLYINDFQKTHWDTVKGTIDFTQSYMWSLCNGNDANTAGQITVELRGYTTSFSSETVVASYSFNVAGSYSCDEVGTGGGAVASFTLQDPVISPDKTVSSSLTLGSITEADLCKNYTVFLYVTPPNAQKGVFCSPSAPTLNFATWDTSKSTAGTYQLQARALATDSSRSNLYSNITSITIGSDGTPVATPGTGSGSGSGQTPGGSSNPGATTQTGTSNLNPITFSVPDLSAASKYKGMDLIGYIMQAILRLLIMIFSMAALVVFIFSGVQYGLSFGDPTKAEKAKKSFTYGIIGTVVILLSYILLIAIGRLIHTIT